jgi:hypothetical protein
MQPHLIYSGHQLRLMLMQRSWLLVLRYGKARSPTKVAFTFTIGLAQNGYKEVAYSPQVMRRHLMHLADQSRLMLMQRF